MFKGWLGHPNWTGIGAIVAILTLVFTIFVWVIPNWQILVPSGKNIGTPLMSNSTPTPTARAVLTPTTVSGTPTNPVADATPLPPPNALSSNPNNPKLPLNISCVQYMNNISIALKSIGYDQISGKYEWAFFITNKSGVACSSIGFNNFYLSLPDNTMYQPTNSISSWPMDVNQTSEEDAFFSGFQPNTRYTLHMLIGSNCGNVIYDNTYRTYDFYF